MAAHQLLVAWVFLVNVPVALIGLVG